MSKLTVKCFTNDKREVLDRAYYRLGREYGYVFRDVVVELTVRDGRVKCGIHEPEKTVLAGCNPEIVRRLVANLDDWLADSGDFYDLEYGEERWPVYEQENDGLSKAIEDVIMENRGDPAQAAQLIVNTWLS
jgi:hypothetical protein